LRGELLIDLIHEFWTDSDEHLDIKRKQLTQLNQEYIAKYPAIKSQVELLNLNRTYIDLLCIYLFYPSYQRHFQGIPIEYERKILTVISDTISHGKQLRKSLSGVDEIKFIFAHKRTIEFLHEIFSHYYQRYPPSEGLLIKWLIINRDFAAQKHWYNPELRNLLRYRERSLATLSMSEFRRIIESRPGNISLETEAVFLNDIYNIALDPEAPSPESTWEFVKPVPAPVQDAMAAEMGLEIVELQSEIVDITTFKSFPLYYLKKHRIIPLRIEKHRLVVAVVDPRITEELEELKQTSGLTPLVKLIRETDFYRIFHNLVNHFLKF
jgi:hypothetical protein